MANWSNFSGFSRTVTQVISQMDAPLLGATLFLLGASILNLYGIGGSDSSFFIRQIILVAVGLTAMMLFSFFNYRYLKNYSMPVMLVYLAACALLLMTLLNTPIRGLRAWIIFSGFTLEPSELAKIAFVIVMAKYFSQRHAHINEPRLVIVSVLYLALPMVIILLQPDVGSAAMLALIWVGMVLAAGINRRHLFVLLIISVVMAYLGWAVALKPYQRERLASYLDPYRDPAGIGYNVIQSKIAIGAGHWFGTGLGMGTQAGLGFLPESQNDFAFAAWAEQFGIVGVVALLSAVLVVLMRIAKIGERAGNNFSKLFAIGMITLIASHVVVNAGVNTGALPVTGIPFSFLSYGGSHLLSVMIGLGILHSMKRYG